MDFPSRFMEVFQEVHKVLGHLIRLKAGRTANGWTGHPALLGFCTKVVRIVQNRIFEMFENII